MNRTLRLAVDDGGGRRRSSPRSSLPSGTGGRDDVKDDATLQRVRRPTPGGRWRRWPTRAPAWCRTTSAVTWTRPTAAAYTSPTNIGAYMWSAVAARELGLISTAGSGASGSRRR